MRKSDKNITIIGGADGPTSIFLLGSRHKDKNPFRRFQHEIQTKKYQYKRNRAKKLIIPVAHTMDETIQYMLDSFGMVEADGTYPLYEECKHRTRFSLAQREHPELLGEPPQLQAEDIQNPEEVRNWYQALGEWEKQADKIVDELPQEAILMDYHMFLLDKGEDGTLQIEIEMNRQLLGTQYSGNCKVMDAIIKDIHLYYGVSQEDIAQNTKRYQDLLAALQV